MFTGETKAQALTGFLAIQQARPEYIRAGLQEIKHKYGSVENYLEQVAGIDQSDMTKLKQIYTE